MLECRRAGLDAVHQHRAIVLRQPAPFDLDERRAIQFRHRLPAGRLGLVDLGDARADHLGFLAAQHLELHRLAGGHDAQPRAQLRRAAHRMAVQRRDDVTLAQPGRRRRRIRLDLGDLRAVDAADVRLHGDAQAPTPHLAVADELRHHRVREHGGHREADADVAARRADDRGVDADQLALQIDQRTARVPRIDRRIGLDEVLVALYRQAAAPQRGHDPGRGGLAQAERIADGHHEVPDLQCVRIAPLRFHQAVRLHPEDCNVGPRVRADQLRRQPPVVLERDLNLARILHHMGVRHHVAVLRIDDHARARGDLRLRLLRHAEEAPEEGIAHERVLFLRAHLQHGDVHHGRRHLLEDRRERRHAFARRQPLGLRRESDQYQQQDCAAPHSELGL